MISRSAWAALALVHAPVLAAVCVAGLREGLDAGRLGSLVALALVTALFTLKAMDVRCLRIGSSRHALLVVCVAGALVHHEAAARATRDLGPVPAAVAVATIALGSGEVLRRLLKGSRARVERALDGLLAAFARPLRAACLGDVGARPRSAPRAAPVAALGGPRAPPALI